MPLNLGSSIGCQCQKHANEDTELQLCLQVLSDISLEVPQGSFHMLVGPNGCGKSTLLKILGGLMIADRGMCHVLPPAGFVFQNPDHQVVMPTVGADVAFGLGRCVMSQYGPYKASSLAGYYVDWCFSGLSSCRYTIWHLCRSKR